MSKYKVLSKVIDKKHNNYETVYVENTDEIYSYELHGMELLEDDKTMTTVVNKIKSIIRTSMEYKEYIDFLKNFKDMRYCTFFNNIRNFNYDTNKYKTNIKIEIHHEPFTLHDYVVTIIRYFLFNDRDIDYLLVAEKVMELHFSNMVGLVPVSLTPHQLVHSENLFVPMSIVYGNYEKFFDQYKEYIPSEIIERYLFKKEKTKQYNHRDNIKILKTKFTYYENDKYKIPMIVNEDKDYESFIKRIREQKLRISF